MTPTGYAVGLTISVVGSLVLIGWVAYEILNVPRPLWVFAMAMTTVLGSAATMIGYGLWLRDQRQRHVLRLDRRKLKWTVMAALVTGYAAYGAARILWDAPQMGLWVVFSSVFVTILVLGSMLSLHTGGSSK